MEVDQDRSPSTIYAWLSTSLLKTRASYDGQFLNGFFFRSFDVGHEVSIEEQ